MQLKTRRWFVRGLLALMVAAVFSAGLTVYLLRRPPAVWTQAKQLLEQRSEQENKQLAQAVLDRLSAKVELDPLSSKSGTVDQTYELQLTNEELFAVVNELFDDWTAQRGYEVPAGIAAPVVLAVDGQLAIAFEVVSTNWSQVFSGYVDLTFQSDGMALGEVVELTAGSLPVSVIEVGDMLQQQLPKGEASLAEQIGQWVSQLDRFEFRPVLELEHRRRARVVDMQVGDDAVTLTMRVQDHETYKRHNALLGIGAVAVTDALPPAPGKASAIADVPTKTE